MTNIRFDKQGNVESLRYGATEFAAQTSDPQGLFIIQFRDKVGNPFRLTQKDFSACEVLQQENCTELVFSGCKEPAAGC